VDFLFGDYRFDGFDFYLLFDFEFVELVLGEVGSGEFGGEVESVADPVVVVGVVAPAGVGVEDGVVPELVSVIGCSHLLPIFLGLGDFVWE